MIVENSYIETGKYGGLAVDVYQGSYKITRAQKGKDGKTYAQWTHPQTYNQDTQEREPNAKAIPFAITLGDNKESAINVLREIARSIKSAERVEAPEIPPEHNTANQDDYGDDIPF